MTFSVGCTCTRPGVELCQQTLRLVALKRLQNACLVPMSKLRAAKNEMQIGGLAHCWWDSSKQDSPSCDVKTLRWNPPKQEQLSEGMPAPGKIKALKMGLPIDRSLCISILLSSLMPFQCQQTGSYKIRRGVGSLWRTLTGTAGLGFAGGYHPTAQMDRTDLFLSD